MLNRLIILCVSGLLLTLTSCAATDHSAKDLTSPCVSNDLDSKSPCARRIPLENYIA